MLSDADSNTLNEEAKNEPATESGRHKVFMFEIMFLIENFTQKLHRKGPNGLMNFEDHPRIRMKA